MLYSPGSIGKRLSGHYISDLKSLALAQAELVKQLTDDDPFWRRKV